jgi:hypothetical protein
MIIAAIATTEPGTKTESGAGLFAAAISIGAKM